MSTETGYNGWPNRETWNVMLWLDNDEGMYRFYRREVQQLRRVYAADAQSIAFQAFGADKTPDGIDLHSQKIRWGKIAAAMRES